MRRSLALLLLAAVLAGCGSVPAAPPSESVPPPELKGQLYVTLGESNRIAAIDLKELKLSTLIGAGKNNHGLAQIPGGPLVMPSSDEGGGIAILDPQNLSVQEQLPLDPKGHHAAADPMGRYIYITTSPDTLTVLDAGTRQTVKVLQTGEGSYYVAAQPEGKLVFVTNATANTVSVVNVETLAVIKNITVPGGPNHLAMGPRALFVYVAAPGDSAVYEVDVVEGKISRTFSLEGKPHGIDITPDGKTVFAAAVADEGTFVAAIDTESGKVSIIDLPGGANHVTMDPGGEAAYVTMIGSKEIVILDSSTRQVASRVPIGYPPHQMVVAPDGAATATATSAPPTAVTITATSDSTPGADPPSGEQAADDEHAAHHR